MKTAAIKGQLRIALIGTQFMGRAHSNAWRQVQPFFEPELVPELAVVCGRDLARTEAFARQWGWRKAVADWREVVTRDDIDAVDLSLPQHLQAEVAIVAAEHGKHIFCEEPMAMKPEEAHAMSQAATGAGVVHAVKRTSSRRWRVNPPIGPTFGMVPACWRFSMPPGKRMNPRRR